jgi:hypothetical protein
MMKESQNQDKHEHHHKMDDTGHAEQSKEQPAHAASTDKNAQMDHAAEIENISHEGHSSHEEHAADTEHASHEGHMSHQEHAADTELLHEAYKS